MVKYIIEVTVEASRTFEVEATTKEEAIIMLCDRGDGKEIDYQLGSPEKDFIDHIWKSTKNGDKELIVPNYD